ncbi:alpha/beta hydrolase [Hyalangium sp.]|uniref:alpha/beta fold hydrolase n=1 Tax=Hyalangium sp. TaxID=2028555 RepID=UPI002D38AC4A|nr:alpha/beta hydrolase [Hyalangium sp.]HYI00938.1 alpha/beta hydrolase [Hyalangium sp.]
MDTFFMELAQARVRVAVVGQGPRTVVIVPDPPNLIEHHHESIQRLASDHRVICFELPGFGRSSLQGGARFGFALQLEVMGEVLERLEARRVLLEMSCLGAMMGLRLALRRPDLVGRLVLAQVSSLAQMQSWARETDVGGLIHTPGVGQVLVAASKFFIARHWYRAALPEGASEALYQQYLQPTLRTLREGGRFELASAYQAVRREEEVDYSGIHQPLLLLWGRGDRTHAATRPQALLEALPQARLVEYEGCGHFPTLEDVDRYIHTLKEWERSLPAVTPAT